MPVKLKCQTCEKDFFVDPYRVKANAKYCSKKCFLEKWTSRYFFQCKNCGKDSESYGCKRNRKKYCSRKCMEEFKHTPLEEIVKRNIKENSNGCWIWQGSISGKSGYGKLVFKKKHFSAHRASYMVFKGDIPKGKHICHTCDNKLCVNPEHLWPGSQRENIQDMIKKGRRPERVGENLIHSDEKVREVRKLKTEGKTYREIYELTGVPMSTSSAIINGARRKHVSP